jgi:hypothetical protein
MQRDIQADD